MSSNADMDLFINLEFGDKEMMPIKHRNMNKNNSMEYHKLFVDKDFEQEPLVL